MTRLDSIWRDMVPRFLHSKTKNLVECLLGGGKLVWQVSVQLSVMVRKRKSWGHSLGSATAGGSAEKPNALATLGSVALGFLIDEEGGSEIAPFSPPAHVSG